MILFGNVVTREGSDATPYKPAYLIEEGAKMSIKQWVEAMLPLTVASLYLGQIGGNVINASNSGSESWTGIGVVADFGAVVLMDAMASYEAW